MNKTYFALSAIAVFSLLAFSISSSSIASALASTTTISVNGTDYTVTSDINSTSTSISAAGGSTEVSGSSDTPTSEQIASTTVSANGTQTDGAISRDGTSASGAVSSGTTSISTSSLNTVSDSTISSVTTTSVNGENTTVSASADRTCVKMSILPTQPTASTVCLIISPDNGGVASGSATVSSGSTTVGGSTSTDSIIPDGTVPSPSPSTFSIEKTQSGRVALDPLDNETMTMSEILADTEYWHYGGSADSLFTPPAPRDLFKDSEGLHIGVQSPTNDTYAGYYAVAPATGATLFHARITTPVPTIDGDYFQNGLYVQTGDGRINYVTCVSITSTAGTSWHIIRTFGNLNEATSFEQLWDDWSANQSDTKDCTIITNGDNYLKVYLDGAKVYESTSIDLQMPGPFLYFLEPQNSHAEMLYGVYKDYYTASGETIRVTDALSVASRVDLVDNSGNVLATAPVSNNTATLDVGMYHFPLAANIKAYGPNNVEIASSSASIFGGDTYAVKLNPKI